MTELVIELNKPIDFEGKEYTQIDLSGIENLNGVDGINAQRLFKKRNPETFFVASYSLEPDYCLIIAEKASSMPLAFFEQLPIRYFQQVVSKVSGFLNSALDE